MTSTKNNETEIYTADGIPLNEDSPAVDADIRIPATTIPTDRWAPAVATPQGPVPATTSIPTDRWAPAPVATPQGPVPAPTTSIPTDRWAPAVATPQGQVPATTTIPPTDRWAPAVATPQGPARVENSPYIHITSRSPLTMKHCPRCGREHARTHVRTQAADLTWLAVFGVCCICWPCFWVPLVVDNCKQTNHYCSGCFEEVGSVKPFQ